MALSEKRRIIFNVLVTYLRSLVALVCGVFTGRWLLMSLGKVDLGLFSVVGGMVTFMSFITWPINSAISRYYAFTVGKATKQGLEGIEECRKWFNVAFALLSILSFLALIIGLPIGEILVRFWLKIPPERVYSCIWVFRWTCLNCLISILKVPFYSMFTAKQNIAELTFCSMVETVLHLALTYFMITHPGDWLRRYAMWHTLSIMFVSIITASLGMVLFPECRFRFAYMKDTKMFRQLFGYSAWMLFGCVGALVRGQGIAILVNKMFSPVANTAISLSNTIVGHAKKLSSSITGAFAPAITNACGAGELDKMRRLVYLSSKLGTYFVLIFIIPLMLELRYVLVLWLKNPPEYVLGMTYCVLVGTFINRLDAGYATAVTASGKIAGYQFVNGTLIVLSLPLTWIVVKFFPFVYAVGISLDISYFLCVMSVVFFADRHAGLSRTKWFTEIVFPMLAISLFSASTGFLTVYCFRPGVSRMLFTTAVVNVTLLLTGYVFALDDFERRIVKEKFFAKMPFFLKAK